LALRNDRRDGLLALCSGSQSADRDTAQCNGDTGVEQLRSENPVWYPTLRSEGDMRSEGSSSDGWALRRDRRGRVGGTVQCGAVGRSVHCAMHGDTVSSLRSGRPVQGLALRSDDRDRFVDRCSDGIGIVTAQWTGGGGRRLLTAQCGSQECQRCEHCAVMGRQWGRPRRDAVWRENPAHCAVSAQ